MRIHVVINPAAGRPYPILSVLNSVFQAAGCAWDVSITKGAGDAYRLIQQAAASGVDRVAVYGGDGTVAEAASALIGNPMPLAILPGGTGNVMAGELGISEDIAVACQLICNPTHKVRQVDMGQIGSGYFLLRASTGLEAQMIQNAGTVLKRVLGSLAYTLSAIQVLREPVAAYYQLTLDGQAVESEGVTCMIANSGRLGRMGVRLSPLVSVSDGLLDVFVITKGDLNSLLALAGSVMSGMPNAPLLQHWQARNITITATPVQTVESDGEIHGETPLSVQVLPQAVRIVVP